MKLSSGSGLAGGLVVLLSGFGGVQGQELSEIYVFKAAWYEQSTAGDPALFPQADQPFDYTAVAYLTPEVLMDPDWMLSFTGIVLRTPSGRTEAVEADLGVGGFILYEGAVTAQALNLRYGAGTHRFTLSSLLTGNSNFDVPLAPDDYPPAPKIANFEAAQHIDAAQDFTLRWVAFTGEGERTAWLELMDLTTFEVAFDPGPLDGDATSVVIPAGTLVEGRDYQATLAFTRYTHMGLDAVPSTYAGFETYNLVPLRTGGDGGILIPSRFTAWNRLANGDLELTLDCTPGRPLTLQGAASFPGAWSVLQTLVPAADSATLTVPREALRSSEYLRAVQE